VDSCTRGTIRILSTTDAKPNDHANVTGRCTVRVCRQQFTLEDAIGSHACSLEALACM
jgi:hypothetical protein